MFDKLIICLSYLIFSSSITSCQENPNNFTRKDCQNGAGYNGYLKGYYTAKNGLQKTPVNKNDLYGYCYMQGYLDALG
jgi:hypothetical protein